MKAVDCRTVTRGVDELDRDQHPGPAILAHVNTCVQCRTFYNDRVRLRDMVAGLPTVAAPADFDFRLRARLATEKGYAGASPRMFGFSIPSVALATIALLVGAGLSMRVLTGPAGDASVAVNETPRASESVRAPAPATGPSAQEISATAPGNDTTTNSLPSEPGAKISEAVVAKNGNRKRKIVRDPLQQFVQRANPVAGTETAAMFPLEASEPLRVSVDYTAGGSRTISLPSLSFGSQQVVSREGSSIMKASARTVW